MLGEKVWKRAFGCSSTWGNRGKKKLQKELNTKTCQGSQRSETTSIRGEQLMKT